MISFLKIFLPLYAVVFVLIVVLWRTVALWKRTGINAYAQLRQQQGVHGVISRYYRGLPLCSALTIILFITPWYSALSPISGLEHSVFQYVGIGLLLLSLVWISVAQIQMGNAWRIGIDSNNQTGLVTHGIFTASRNPIFLGIKLNSLGFFLILPNALTFAVLLVGVVLIHIQVALEEEYLLSTYGDKYKEYCLQVRRWI